MVVISEFVSVCLSRPLRVAGAIARAPSGKATRVELRMLQQSTTLIYNVESGGFKMENVRKKNN